MIDFYKIYKDGEYYYFPFKIDIDSNMISYNVINTNKSKEWNSISGNYLEKEWRAMKIVDYIESDYAEKLLIDIFNKLRW